MDMQRTTIIPDECQFACLKSISIGNGEMPKNSPVRHLTLAVRRRLSPAQDRILHRKLNSVIEFFSKPKDQESASEVSATNAHTVPLKAGDMVRVKSKEEIQATLNHLGQTKGCTFGTDMLQYCGSVQRVLKPMERFVDERDLRVKKCKGLILLEGVMCQGTTVFGRCDRSCYTFWREEWLEKIE